MTHVLYPASVRAVGHIGLGTAQWLLWEPSNTPRQMPEMALMPVKWNLTLLYFSKLNICLLNPKADIPPFAATVAAASPLQLYQVDPVHQSLGLIKYWS